MNEMEWVEYVNKHIDPVGELPQLTVDKLKKWQRYGLLYPSRNGYTEQDIMRSLNLLMLEKEITRRQRETVAV